LPSTDHQSGRHLASSSAGRLPEAGERVDTRRCVSASHSSPAAPPAPASSCLAILRARCYCSGWSCSTKLVEHRMGALEGW